MHYLEKNEPCLERQIPCFLLYVELVFKLGACIRVLVRVFASVCAWMHKRVCVCSRMGEYACSMAHVSVLNIYPCGNQCAHTCTYRVYTYVCMCEWGVRVHVYVCIH